MRGCTLDIHRFTLSLFSLSRRTAPRRVSSCFVSSSSLFLHTLNFKLSLQLLLSMKTSPWSRFFLRYHSSRFTKRKLTKNPPRLRLKPVEGSTRSPTPLPRIPLNGLSLASPFRNRSMELVSSPRLDFSVGYFAFHSLFLFCFTSLCFAWHCFVFLSPHFPFPSLTFLHLSSFPFNHLCFDENFITRRVV